MEEVKWVRKLRPIEEFYVRAQYFGQMHTCYHLKICSKQPLHEDHVKAAVQHLYR